MRLQLNNAYIFGGKIHSIGETQEVKEGFQKREVTVNQTTFSQMNGKEYNEFVKFELVNDNCSAVDNFKIGDFVNIKFNLKGNLWADKKAKKPETAIVTLQAWKIEAAEVPQEG